MTGLARSPQPAPAALVSRRPRRRLSPAMAVAALLAVATFGLYGVTAGQLVGYEGETAAVAQGLVERGVLQVLPGTRLSTEGIPGRGGHRYSRTGLTQPLLEAPFYFVGARLDAVASGSRGYTWRLAMLRLFNPVMAMGTVLAAFGLLLLRGVALRRAAGVAILIAVGTLVWPYAKIGMDTTLMAMVALTMCAAAWAARRPSAARLALTGVAGALAVSTKPYGILLLAGVVPLLLGPLRARAGRERWLGLLALAVPLVVGIASVGWYNALRSGSPTNFLHPNPTDLVDTPLNVLGLLVSPGRGLVVYSPLVILGVLGLREVRREDPALAWAIVLPVVINVGLIGATYVWTDDTWGPRYIIPTVWLLVLPTAWWVRTALRRRVLGGLAAVAILVQVLGVFAKYDVSTVMARRLSGVFVWPIGLAPTDPYGGDPTRWVPQLSPVLLNGELFAAWIGRHLAGDGFTVTYDPTWGRTGQLDLSEPSTIGGVLPDVWWRFPGQTAGLGALAVVLGVMALGGGAGVARRLRT